VGIPTKEEEEEEDGVNKTQTDALMFELLKNTTDLQAL